LIQLHCPPPEVYYRPFTKTTGFFRPLVSLTFGLQYQLHGLHPKPFGLFNLLLHLLNIILVYFLLTCRKETKQYALGATILFALNAKAAGMAVGWISGRTTLLVSFFLKGEPANVASDYLFYFSFLLFFRFVSFYTGNVLTSTRFQNIRFYILITSAILMLLLEVILGKLYLIYGIISARAVVELFLFVAYLLALKKIKNNSLNSGV